MENNTKEILLQDLLYVFAHRVWIIILVAVLCVLGAYTANTLTYVPVYSSTATVYILRDINENTASYDAVNDFNLALNVVHDCDILLKSNTVLDAVIDELELEMSYKDLENSIATANPEDTRILHVTATADTPDNAKRIVDSVCRIGSEKINDVMGYDQVDVYEYGTISNVPSNERDIIFYMLVGFMGAVFTYALCLFLYIVDTSIRTDEDIQNYLGLSILGDIPDAAETAKLNGYRYKGKYGRYGKYKYENKRYGYGVNNTAESHRQDKTQEEVK